jgi:hypothetical protein
LGGSFDAIPPSLTQGRKEFVYLPSEPRIPIANFPRLNHSYRMTAEVIIPEVGAEGILATFGNRANGFAWYVKDDRVVYENNAGTHSERITSRIPLPRGKATLAYEFRRDSTGASSESETKWSQAVAGTGYLYINGELAAEERHPVVKHFSWGSNALYIGRTAGVTVSDAYTQPSKFTGTIKHIKLERLCCGAYQNN